MSVWKKVKLKNLIKYKTGKLDSNAMEEDGKYPFFTCDPKTFLINTYAFDTTAILLAGNNAKGIFPIKFYSGKFNCYQRTYVLENKDNNISDLKFLFFAIKIQLKFLGNMSSGSTTKFLTKGMIENLIVELPSLKTQKKISKILTYYDDLIKNNLNRIALLEEYGKLIYEEWFLRFKIDNKESNIDKSTNLPLGWKKIKVKDYVAIISKGPSLNYDLGESEGVEVLNQSCIRNGEIELEKVLIAKKLNNNQKLSYLKINDILINSMGTGTLGRVSRNVSIKKKMIIHNCITFLRAKDIYSQYILFYFISSHKEYFESIASGSTGQSTLKKELIEDLTITLPDNKFIKKFDLIMSSVWKEIGIIKNQNKLLKESQDIILPRLMIGMIDTDNMKIAV